MTTTITSAIPITTSPQSPIQPITPAPSVVSTPSISQTASLGQDYVYLFPQQTGYPPVEDEAGRSLEDISSRIFWDITKDPGIKENVKILRSNYSGFYDDSEVQVILEMQLRRFQSNQFFYIIPLVPGYTVYSSIKEASLSLGVSFTLKSLLTDIYNFYEKKVRQEKGMTFSQPSQPSSTVTQALNFKAMILNMIPPTTPYAKYIDKLLDSISTGSEMKIFHRIFGFRTMFNGFLTTPNPETFTVTQQGGSPKTITDYIYILNLANSIIPMETSANIQPISDKKYLKNIIKEAMDEHKSERQQRGEFRGEARRGCGWGGGRRGGGRGGFQQGSSYRGSNEG